MHCAPGKEVNIARGRPGGRTSDCPAVGLFAARLAGFGAASGPGLKPLQNSQLNTLMSMSMTQPPSLLIVDDDRELGQMLTEYLSGEGFQVSVLRDGAEALERLIEQPHPADLVILDVMLPSLSGFEVLRRLRRNLSVPVIMLTAHGTDVDRIVGLELGADDYLAKPFNPRELVARVRAVLRRFSPRDADAPAHPVSIGP